MIYVFRERNSSGARDLAEGITLQGTLARRTKGERLRTLADGDSVVCWGSNFAAAQGTKTLNNVPVVNKFTEARTLREKGVPTIEVSQTRPNVAAARPPFIPNNYQLQGGNFNLDDLAVVVSRVQQFQREELARRQAWERQPAVPAQTWLPRKNNHVGGNDLLADTLNAPDFYSKKENITEEYRLHMFLGKSIRAGKKIQRPTRPDGRTAPHQWIRSFDAGWVIDYTGFESTKEMRELAASALTALGLDFGAVDIGRKSDGTLIVLEVNRAPGVEGGTVEAYAKKIIAWSKGELDGDKKKPVAANRRPANVNAVNR